MLSNFKQTLIAENQIRNGPFDTNHVGEPIGFDVLPDGRVLQTTRNTGTLPGQTPPPQNIQNAQLWLHSADGTQHTILSEFLVYNNSEDGLYGPAIDNDFEKNKWVYLYYSPAVMDPPFPSSTPPGGAPTFGATPGRLGSVAGLLPAQPLQARRRADPAPRPRLGAEDPQGARSTAAPAATSPATSRSTPTTTSGSSPVTTRRPAAATPAASARSTTG